MNAVEIRLLKSEDGVVWIEEVGVEARDCTRTLDKNKKM